MAEVDHDVRRVSVHADGHTVDLSLPAAVPIAELMPSVLDLLRTERDLGAVTATPARYQLSLPGTRPVDPSMTLAHNGIRNGALLVLTRSTTELPAPSFDDAAEAVSSTLAEAARPWTRQSSRLTGAIASIWLAGLGALLMLRRSFHHDTLGVAVTTACVALLAAVLAGRVYREPVAAVTLGLTATGFAAAAGFLAVPDGPGPPNALLAAMAAGVVAVLAVRATGCGALTFTTVSCLALVIAVAALATVVIAGPLRVMGSLTTVVSLALLEVSARLSIAWAGLSPQLPARLDGRHGEPAPDQLRRSALRADDILTCLVVASTAASATGAVCTAFGADAAVGARSGAVSFAAITGAVLLLRARSHPDFIKTLALLAAGTVALSAAFVVAGAVLQRPVWMVAGIAAPVGAATGLGFVVPALNLSPIARRGVELVEYLAMIAIVPLACWTCGFYSVARSVHLL